MVWLVLLLLFGGSASFLPELTQSDDAYCSEVLDQLVTEIVRVRQARHWTQSPASCPLAVFGTNGVEETLKNAKVFASLRKHGLDSDPVEKLEAFLFGEMRTLSQYQFSWTQQLANALDALDVGRVQADPNVPQEVLWAAGFAALAALGYQRILFVGSDVMAVRQLPLAFLPDASDNFPRLSGVPRGPLMGLLMIGGRKDEAAALQTAVSAADLNAAWDLYREPALDPAVLLFDARDGEGRAKSSGAAAAAATALLRGSYRALRFLTAAGIVPSPTIVVGTLGAAALASGRKSPYSAAAGASAEEAGADDLLRFRFGELPPEWAHRFGRNWLSTEFTPIAPVGANGDQNLSYAFDWVPQRPGSTLKDPPRPPIFVRFVLSAPWDNEVTWESWQRNNPAISQYFAQWRRLPLLPLTSKDQGGSSTGRVSGYGDDLAAEDELGSVLFNDDASMLRIKRCKAGTFMYVVNDFIGAALDSIGEWEDDEQSLAAALVQPGWTVLDLGGNIGVHAVRFARMVGPTGKVVSAEPQKIMYGLLVANTVLNGVQHIVDARNVAIGARHGAIDVPYLQHHGQALLVNFAAVELGKDAERPWIGALAYKVPLVTIDSMVQGLGGEVDEPWLKCPHFVKLDIEGMELEALRGGERTLAHCEPLVYMEANKVRRPAVAALLQFMWQREYFCNYHNFLTIRAPEKRFFPSSRSVDVGTEAEPQISWNMLCGKTEEHRRAITPLGLTLVRNPLTDDVYTGPGCDNVSPEFRELLTGTRDPLCWPREA